MLRKFEHMLFKRIRVQAVKRDTTTFYISTSVAFELNFVLFSVWGSGDRHHPMMGTRSNINKNVRSAPYASHIPYIRHRESLREQPSKLRGLDSFPFFKKNNNRTVAIHDAGTRIEGKKKKKERSAVDSHFNYNAQHPNVIV